MKAAAVITEFNPFHSGHEYFLKEVRKRSGADILIAVMSGDFVQRGEPAIIDKYLRAESALRGGCDLVLELPVRFSLSSAGGFASGAIDLIRSLQIADELWFGSECGDIDQILSAAKILKEEPEDFKAVLRSGLKTGVPYPEARQKALESIAGIRFSDLLNGSNNVLGIEYAAAASGTGLKLNTVRRMGSDYSDASIGNGYPSALAIRQKLLQSSSAEEDVLSSMNGSVLPDPSRSILSDAPGYLTADDFSDLLRYRMLEESKESLCDYLNVTPDLARRIKNNENRFLSFTDFAAGIKTRNYTYTHISRALFCIVLKLRKEPLFSGRDQSFRYIRMLGMKEQASEALSVIKKKSPVKMLASSNAFPDHLYDEDGFASAVYESIRSIRFQTPFIHESERKFIRLP